MLVYREAGWLVIFFLTFIFFLYRWVKFGMDEITVKFGYISLAVLAWFFLRRGIRKAVLKNDTEAN